MNINMRKGFTMIELVFVIVIIGILSAVALPKLLDTVGHAHDAKVETFAKTITRSNGPTLWAMSQSAGNNGDITGYCADLMDYMDIPDEISYDGDCTFTVNSGSGSSYASIEFTNGAAQIPPRWNTVK